MKYHCAGEKTAVCKTSCLTVVGMAGFWSFFNSLIYPSAVFGSTADGNATFSIVASVALLVVGIVVGMLEARRPATNKVLARTLLASSFACALFLAISLISNAGNFLLSAAFAILLGGSVALLGIGWARVNESHVRDGGNASSAVVLSMLACNLVIALISALLPWTSREQFIPIPVYVLLLLSDLACAHLLHGDDGPLCSRVGNATGASGRSGSGTPIMIATLGIYFIASGMLRGVYSMSESTTGITGSLLHAALLAVFLVAAALYSFVWSRKGRPNRLPCVAFVLVCVIALYATVLLSGTRDYISNELLLPTRPMVMLLIWGELLNYALASNRSFGFAIGCIGLPLFGLGRIAVHVVWSILTSQGNPSLELGAPILGVSFLLTVGVVAALTLPNEPSAEAGSTNQALSNETPGAPEHSAARVAELSKLYSLSEREAQVLGLLVAGNSRAKIAELLVLSVNSVQTYAKSLYRKLDVHSRQELIDFVRDKQ